MKVLRIHSGTVAVRASPDEIFPRADRAPLLDFLLSIQQRYQFQIFPMIDAAHLDGPFIFQVGKFANSELSSAIDQIVMQIEGDSVTASSTDLAELILKDLHGFLDETFHFRSTSANQKRSYASAVVVEFESAIEKQIEFIGRVEELINLSEGKLLARMFKRLSFGIEDQNIPRLAKPPVVTPVENFERLEFVIERRVGEPFSSNRYFCLAPMRTQDHIRVLEQVDELLKTRRRK